MFSEDLSIRGCFDVKNFSLIPLIMVTTSQKRDVNFGSLSDRNKSGKVMYPENIVKKNV